MTLSAADPVDGDRRWYGVSEATLQPWRRSSLGRRTGATLVHVHVSTLLADALDPVLTASVFTAGQTGLGPDDVSSGRVGTADGQWPDQPGSVIWCAAYGKVQENLPSLPQAHGDGIGVDYGCVDLTVTITRGILTEVDLEGLSLAETFSALGRYEEARSAERLLDTSAQAASGPLAELLAALLQPSGSD
jgi:hypothetical protein